MPNVYFIDIINPDNPGGPKVQAHFSPDVYLQSYKLNPVDYENLRAAKYVLENTCRIFSGIREFNDGGWCFTGKPKMWYIRQTV